MSTEFASAQPRQPRARRRPEALPTQKPFVFSYSRERRAITLSNSSSIRLTTAAGATCLRASRTSRPQYATATASVRLNIARSWAYLRCAAVRVSMHECSLHIWTRCSNHALETSFRPRNSCTSHI